MTRKLILAGIVLIGFTLALGSNAWADRGRYCKGHKYAKYHHHCHKAHHGHHYGWDKGRKHHPRRCYRHHRARRHRDHVVRRKVVEKHVYHHYPRETAVAEDGVKFVFSVADALLGVSVEVNSSY